MKTIALKVALSALFLCLLANAGSMVDFVAGSIGLYGLGMWDGWRAHGRSRRTSFRRLP